MKNFASSKALRSIPYGIFIKMSTIRSPEHGSELRRCAMTGLQSRGIGRPPISSAAHIVGKVNIGNCRTTANQTRLSSVISMRRAKRTVLTFRLGENKPHGKEIIMARYTRRRTTRAPARRARRTGYSARSGRYAAPRRRTVSRRRSTSRRSSTPRTIRIVVQTVGASPTNQSSVVPLRAQF